jgi:hypothetical protein
MTLIINYLIFFTRKKNNPVNILDYYVNENKEDSDTDNVANEEYFCLIRIFLFFRHLIENYLELKFILFLKIS